MLTLTKAVVILELISNFECTRNKLILKNISSHDN